MLTVILRFGAVSFGILGMLFGFFMIAALGTCGSKAMLLGGFIAVLGRFGVVLRMYVSHIGAGSVMAGLVSNVPQLIFVSRHKVAFFIFAGVMLSISGVMQWRNHYAACPAGPAKAKACLRLRLFSRIVFGVSLAAYLTGLFFSYVAKYLFE